MSPASRKILLLEDDPLLANLFGGVLQHAGYEVSAASTGQEAMLFGQTCGDQIDLVVADVVLKDEAALPIVGRLAKLIPGMRVLFVSGFPFDILVETGWLNQKDFQGGTTYFLQKPFLPAELVGKINSVLSGGESANDARTVQLNG